jgi:hypothetical protein
MSIERIEVLVAEFPQSFRDPVVGYAKSVKAALPEIFREADLRPDHALEDEVVFIAGIRKLYAIVSSTFWTLQKALSKLSDRDIPRVRIGGRAYSFDSPEYRQLQTLYDSLHDLLEEDNLLRFMRGMNYAALLRILANERREN